VKDKGALQLGIEEIADSEAEAAATADALRKLLGLLKAIQRAQQPEPGTTQERAVRELVESVKIEQKKDQATLTAVVPAEALRGISGQ
jgi:hypothetical protein